MPPLFAALMFAGTTMLVGRPNPPPPSFERDSFGTASFVYLADPSFVQVDRGGFANVLAVAVLCLQVKFWSVKLPALSPELDIFMRVYGTEPEFIVDGPLPLPRLTSNLTRY